MIEFVNEKPHREVQQHMASSTQTNLGGRLGKRKVMDRRHGGCGRIFQEGQVEDIGGGPHERERIGLHEVMGDRLL